MIDINLNFQPTPWTSCVDRNAPSPGIIYQFPIDDYVYIMPAPHGVRGPRVRAPEVNLVEAADGPLVRFLGWLGGWMDGRRG